MDARLATPDSRRAIAIAEAEGAAPGAEVPPGLASPPPRPGSANARSRIGMLAAGAIALDALRYVVLSDAATPPPRATTT